MIKFSDFHCIFKSLEVLNIKKDFFLIYVQIHVLLCCVSELVRKKDIKKERQKDRKTERQKDSCVFALVSQKTISTFFVRKKS